MLSGLMITNPGVLLLAQIRPAIEHAKGSFLSLIQKDPKVEIAYKWIMAKKDKEDTLSSDGSTEEEEKSYRWPLYQSGKVSLHQHLRTFYPKLHGTAVGRNTQKP